MGGGISLFPHFIKVLFLKLVYDVLICLAFCEPIFQYSISCGNIDEAFGVLIKRHCLSDCFVDSFELNTLKAFESHAKVCPVNGFSPEIIDYAKNIDEFSVDKIEDMYNESHQEISILEAFSLFDKSIHRSTSSSSLEYVDLNEDRKSYFRKVSQKSDHSLKLEGSDLTFEQLTNNVDRYLKRTNGEFLSLAEFCSYYDYMGYEESRQVVKLFEKTGSKIEDSDVKCAYSSNNFLPEIIFINNKKKDVMKIRSVRYVIKTSRPFFSFKGGR